MCGIAGIVSQNPSQVYTGRLKKMADAVAHRGPDGEGFWINPGNTVGLAHRRLSVIDLSPEAAQPMHFSSDLAEQNKRYTITYNGEIYNYLEIREELFSKGYRFQNRCDTEVILAAYDCYKEECLQYFDGMFAFTIWDEKEQVFFAARDRFGEKPFFYSVDEKDNTFYFASEMKALWAAGIHKDINKQALLYYLGLGFTQFPLQKEKTFYNNINTLLPAHYIKWHIREKSFTVNRYWNIDKTTVITDQKDAAEKFRSLFFTSVKRRLRSDVEVGTNLSGGLDSSSIVAVINNLITSENYKCFSAVFPGYEKDESPYIDEVVTAFGLDDFKVIPTAQNFLQDFDKLCYHHEQPFGSSSVYTQYAVCRLAKQNDTKVVLDGQGADETIGGYSKHIHWYLQELLARRKFALFSSERAALKENNIAFEWGYKNYLAAYTPDITASVLQRRENKNLMGNDEIATDFMDAYYDKAGVYKASVRNMNDILYHDVMEFGLEDLLRYADRNSMAHSVEMRLPYLSHELVEFIFTLPAEYKIQNGYPKWILRESVKFIMPSNVTWRKNKIGFEPPQKDWMDNVLFREKIQAAKQKLSKAGILKKNTIDKPVRSAAAYAPDNYDWRYLVASAMFNF
ncbi:MAG: asparagine synthase (glutamine-hydrolyzing) [Agriterribacter sp.]